MGKEFGCFRSSTDYAILQAHGCAALLGMEPIIPRRRTLPRTRKTAHSIPLNGEI
ncbi:hypothetical protein [Nitrosomonas sp. Nm33]|uniref:hypothetical protein n=1 Tax=Nitrosomonas sp. Nm33 TaxID=133724 RepID=UPI000899F6C3|nr:hypothetical protein [Nitrosomonas sp. Nm33]SDY35438.1 hypothetical protein SAMN05421755_101746 [Nitrosomonas sp. Nm33]